MNIFRSEDDVRSWDRFDAGSADAIRPVAEYFGLFQSALLARRLEPDYLVHVPELWGEFFGALNAMGDDSFWDLPPME